MTESRSSGKIARAEIIAQKQRLRREIRKRLAKQEDKERTEKSEEIKKRLFSSHDFRRAKAVMFYVAKDDEVDTRLMIQAALRIGKKVLVPEIRKATGELIASQIFDFEKELRKGPYGIYHPQKNFLRPVADDEIDLVIVPGLAFDREGHRLGRGAGYYDRFLKRLPAKANSLGLAFDFQIITCLPTLATDIPVGKVLSA